MDSKLSSAVAPPSSAPGNGIGGATHVFLCPLTPPGHFIPFLDLARRLLTRGLTITIWVLPQKLELLEPLLADHPSSLQPLVLSPPDPASASFVDRLRAFAELRAPVMEWFRAHPNPPVAVVSDFLMGWTNQMARELGVPRVLFFTSSALAMSLCHSLWRDLLAPDDPENPESAISFPKVRNSPAYRWWQVSPLRPSYRNGDPDGEFLRDNMLANMASWGAVINSFSDLEGDYLDHLKTEYEHDRVWAVGPLLTGEDSKERGGASSVPAREISAWLDERADDSVVYVCFGSRHAVDGKEAAVLAAALELSGVSFVWSVRLPEEEAAAEECRRILEGLEGWQAAAGGRGLVIRGWAPQVAILRHRAVGAFLTHCGWNSTLEGVAAGTVMLTWPMGADQFVNAKMLVEEVGVGIRVGEEARRVPEPEELARTLAESVVDGAGANHPKRVRAAELREAARAAVEGGSSAMDMDAFVRVLGELRRK